MTLVRRQNSVLVCNGITQGKLGDLPGPSSPGFLSLQGGQTGFPTSVSRLLQPEVLFEEGEPLPFPILSPRYALFLIL